MKVIHVEIERSHKIDVVFFICMYLLFFWIGGFENGRYDTILFITFGIIVAAGELLIEKFAKKARCIEAEFQEEQVKLFINKKEKILLYKDIIEVQKIMKITRYTTEKGSYRVKVCVDSNLRNGGE